MGESQAMNPLMWYLLGLGAYLMICGLAGCYVSAQKGRSCGEGFLLSALFGPAGLIVAACLPERPMPVDEGWRPEERSGVEAAARAHLAAMERAAGPRPRRLLGEAEG